ncbi:MAG: MFS transporter [Spirochaetes bacterium]|nr:MFS transporter [Spirochaetota bacterium]
MSLFDTLKDDSQKRFLLIASAIAFLAIGASQAMYGPFYGVFRNTFDLSAARVALTTTLHFAGSTAALLIGGVLVRKYGSIAVISVSAVLLTLGFAAIAIATSFIMVLAGALLVGVGFGGVQFLNFLIARVFVKHRGAALNLLNSLFGIGALLAPLGAAPFVLRNSFRPLFGIAAVFGIAVVVLLALQPHAIGREPAVHRRDSRSLGFLASVLGFLLLYFFYIGAETSLTSWIPTHLAISYADGFSARMTGLFWASLTIGRLVAVPISDRIAPGTLLRIGVLGSLCAVLLAQVEAVAPVAYLLAGFCFGPFFSGGLAWIAERFPDQSSPISALVLAGGGFGAIAFPPLIGSLVDAFSPQLIPLAIAVVTACALATALILGLGHTGSGPGGGSGGGGARED